MTKISDQIISQAIDLAIGNNARFFAYHLPDSSEAVFGVQQLENYNCKHGFLIHPFAPNDLCKEVVITPQLSAQEYLHNVALCNLPLRSVREASTSMEDYLYLAEKSIKAIKGDYLRKVVISRVIVSPYKANVSCGEIFFRLITANPTAFTFVFNHPDTGAWMGASPESLLDTENGGCHTMALAATKPSSSHRAWTKKEIDEQCIVSDFIADTFLHLGLAHQRSETYNRKAAGVQHLCTDFFAECTSDKIDKLTAALHPTPAISGMPKQRAIDFILANESHDRKYYGGYLGPLDKNGNFSYFVNLRSMQFDNKKCCIYVGGGLTAESNPLDEWEETNLKSRLLLDLIEN